MRGMVKHWQRLTWVLGCLQVELFTKWLALDAGLRQQVKQLVVASLGSEVRGRSHAWICTTAFAHLKAGLDQAALRGVQVGEVRHTAAQVVAKIAAIELPQRQWPELISGLLANMGAGEPANEGLKRATLEALGYVCEEMGNIREDVLEQEQVNNILTAVVQGMQPSVSDMETRYTATQALYNALEFAHTNFETEGERNYIMQVVCAGAAANIPANVRRMSFECLVKISSQYYERLPPYIGQIFELSRMALDGEEEVALQALEFLVLCV